MGTPEEHGIEEHNGRSNIRRVSGRGRIRRQAGVESDPAAQEDVGSLFKRRRQATASLVKYGIEHNTLNIHVEEAVSLERATNSTSQPIVEKRALSDTTLPSPTQSTIDYI